MLRRKLSATNVILYNKDYNKDLNKSTRVFKKVFYDGVFSFSDNKTGD